MPQNAEATAFLARVAELPTGPGVSLDDVLKPSLADEAELRKLFAQEKSHPRLADKYVGLVDIFDAPKDIRTTRARVVASEEDLNAKYIMPLSEERRRKEGTPAMVDGLEDFKKNWAVFTEGSLSQLTDWSNVIAAGGSVQACLAPVPESAKASKRSLRKYFHNKAFPTSDVDLFLYGLTPEQAEVKINHIYEAVRDSIPWDVTCIRTKHTVSIHSQYPYRAVQIVLRLYQSPAEVLAGFDVDAPCCAYDGNRVYANPRAIVAMMRQCNTTDVTRRSPSYEVRLTKYSSRDFEVFVPQLNRADIDPTIFERSIVRIQGLARLLVLERLATATDREGYLQSRREIRGRPQQQDSWRRFLKKKYKGDLKADADAGLEMSDYDVVSLHIPYGPGWDARRIEKLVYQTDLGMNSPYNPKNKGRTLHRHAAFFGTMPECLADCCEHCPVPKNDEDREHQEGEDKNYVRGRVQFIVEDPGRQSISGSFNPIDEGEWSEQAYIGITEKFFNAIAAHDREAVAAAVKDGIDVNRRDHVGRTPLQVAVLSKATDIACDLIDANARMTARIVDGRTALHLAAQLNLPAVVRKMLERSAINDEEAKAAAEKEAEEKVNKIQDKDDKMDTEDIDIENSDGEDDEDMRDSSEDDWDSDEDGAERKKKKTAGNDEGSGIIPEDAEDEPDVFQIDALDWDYTLSALDYAVAAGSLEVVELLLANGANPKLVTKPKHSYQVRYCHPLILTATTEDEEKASQIAEKLISAGAVTSEADDDLLTIFHRSIYSERPGLVSTFLKVDPNAKVVLTVPWMDAYHNAVFPIVSAVNAGAYSVLAVLLAHGAKLRISRDDFQRARDMRMKNTNYAPQKFLSSTPMPIEVALANYDEVATLLAALGADLNLPTKESLVYANNRSEQNYTVLDWARAVGEKLKEIKSNDPDRPKSSLTSSATTMVMGSGGLLFGGRSNIVATPAVSNSEVSAWKTEFSKMVNKYDEVQRRAFNPMITQKEYIDDIKAYYEEMVEVLTAHQAKPGTEVWKGLEAHEQTRRATLKNRMNGYYYPHRAFSAIQNPFVFYRHGLGTRVELNALYEELYTACWQGDNAKIRKLCLPQPGRKAQDLPLQISLHWGNNWQGFTPLFVALHRRHWETAKLILAIAAAQYKPKKAEEKRFSTLDLARPDNDSDDDFINDEDDDATMEEDNEEVEIDLVDIAKIPTEVHSNTAPTYMLNNVLVPYVGKDGKNFFVTPLTKAIMDDDFEAFVQILDLYNVLPERPDPYDAMSSIIVNDRPAMLDEYIRRTGRGITLKKEPSAEDGSSQDTEADPDTDLKSYLGLNVHGKKRKDLATKNDPHAHNSTIDELPILWTAARCGAIAVVRYLASDQPLAAYKYYASTHSDHQAKMIRKASDLGALLPEKLGWTTTKLNESVTTAAIAGAQADTLEALCAMRGNELESTLHLKHRTKGFNSILAAVRYSQDTKMFDFLLSKGVSPLETDHNGWNIYHVLSLCTLDASFELLKHALKHLPKEISERLFRQQTKENRCTPLHLAVKAARLDIVKLFVESGASQFLVRESEGYTPLQLAVENNRPKIAKVLAETGPVEALTLEDGVGNTPLEVATRQAFLAKLDVACGNFKCPPSLRLNYNTNPFDLAKKETELPRLRATIDALLHEGRLANGTKLSKELLTFADRLEARITKEKAKAEEKRQLEESKAKNDTGSKVEKDAGGTASEVLKVLIEALSARPTLRHLVHLSDVHESVTRSLELFSKNQAKDARTRQVIEDEGLPEEQQVTESALTEDWDQLMNVSSANRIYF